jgi:hypothetical protein
MSRNSDVFQVLVPTSVTIAPTATTLAALAVGQIGAFSYDTNLALNPAALATEDFYFAVKVLNLDGVADVRKSTGHSIQVKNNVSFTNKIYTAPVNMVTNNTFEVIVCGDEIGVKIEVRNQEAYRLNGFNQVVKTYLVPTSDCVNCDAGCFDKDCAAVLTALVALINADPDSLVTASQVAPTATDPVDACQTGTDGYVAGKLILTVDPAILKDWCNINLGYFYPHQTQIIVTPLGGFADTTEATAMVFSDGQGYDIKQLEYEAGGWNGNPGPYRVSPLVGTALGDFQFFAQVGTNYDVVQVQHDHTSISGWRKDDSFQRTIIAAPNGAVGTAVSAFVALVLG